MIGNPEVFTEFGSEPEFDEIRPHHNCGVAAVVLDPESTSNSAFVATNLLTHLQHRGPDGAGVAVFEKDSDETRGTSNVGSVKDVLNQSSLSGLNEGEYAIGQVRYPTQGSSGKFSLDALQPIHYPDFWLGHNGQFDTEIDGYPSDTFKVGALISERVAGGITLEAAVVDAVSGLENSAYSMVLMNKDGVLAVRDPVGFHPLFYGYSNHIKGYVVASETPALGNVGVSEWQSVPPGHMLKLVSGKEPDLRPFVEKPTAPQLCALEAIYFARADGNLENEDIYQMRREMGRLLAEKDRGLQADVVMSVPDSARAAAQGYAQTSGLRYEEGFIKTTSDRAFLQNSPEERQSTADRKLQIIRSQVEGRRIVLVEDSIVRGDTLKGLVYRLKNIFGAEEVHLRIASPPLMWKCTYGIDIPTREELIAFKKDGDAEEIGKYLEANSLRYLETQDLKKAMGRQLGARACLSCFIGQKPQTKFVYKNPFANESSNLEPALATISR